MSASSKITRRPTRVQGMGAAGAAKIIDLALGDLENGSGLGGVMGPLEPVALPAVLRCRHDPQVIVHLQAGDELVLQRDVVIDLVRNARGTRERRALS